MSETTKVVMSSLPGTISSFATGFYLNNKVSSLSNEIQEYKQKLHELIEIVKKMLMMNKHIEVLEKNANQCNIIIKEQKYEIDKLKEENKYLRKNIQTIYENIDVISDKMGIPMKYPPKKKKNRRR